MKFCPKCGGSLSTNDKFCPYCGFNILNNNLGNNTNVNFNYEEYWKSHGLSSLSQFATLMSATILWVLGFFITFFAIVYLLKASTPGYLQFSGTDLLIISVISILVGTFLCIIPCKFLHINEYLTKHYEKHLYNTVPNLPQSSIIKMALKHVQKINHWVINICKILMWICIGILIIYLIVIAVELALLLIGILIVCGCLSGKTWHFFPSHWY